MDVIMDAADPLFLDAVYAKLSPGWMGADRSDMTRQFISLYLIVLLGGLSPTPIPPPLDPYARGWVLTNVLLHPAGTMLYLFFSGLDWSPPPRPRARSSRPSFSSSRKEVGEQILLP